MISPEQQESSYFSSESGIDVKPMDEEMQIVGTAEFEPPSDIDMPIPGFPSRDESGEENLPPSFSRSQWVQDSQSDSPAGFPAGEQRVDAAGTGEGVEGEDGFPFEQGQMQRGAYISSKREYAGNEVLYKIITIALTLISFFTLRIIDTLRIGTSNPYDKIFFLRLIIFAIIFAFTGYLFFIKTLGKKESLIKKVVILLVVMAFIGSFIGITGINTSEESNFFVSDTDEYYRIMQSGKGYARMPSFSPNGKNAVAHYKPDPALSSEIVFLNLRLDNKESPAKVVQSGILCVNQIFWYSQSKILYPAKKVNPTEPFRFRLADASTGAVSDYYVTYDYNFITDYDYNINTKRITAAFANLIWMLEVEAGEVNVLTGLDMLLRQFEIHPEASEYTNNPHGFIKRLMNNLPYVTGTTFMDASPRFNREGNKIYFTRGNPSDQMVNDIYRVDIERIFGDKVPSGLSSYQDLHDYMMETSELITSDSYHYGNLAVSPSGRFVASWVWARKSVDPAIRMDENALVIYDVEAKTQIRIFPTYPTEAYIQFMDWSPDSKYIIADMNSGLNSILVLIKVPTLIVGLDRDYLE
jgi:hypothetical protein